MPPRRLGKAAKIVNAAMPDAGRARTHATDPAFRESVQNDGRGELSQFKTVRQALADRERIEKNKAATAKSQKK